MGRARSTRSVQRLLRMHALALGLDPAFTVLDRGDAADLIDLGPRGSRRREGRSPVSEEGHVPRDLLAHRQRARARSRPCSPMRTRGAASTRPRCAGCSVRTSRTSSRVTSSTTTTCCCGGGTRWRRPRSPRAIRARFDHVLVDEYQDTNALQAEIVVALAPSGKGVTAVGDDAQAIYSFRAATIHNILAFPRAFATPARLIPLEANYRSTTADRRRGERGDRSVARSATRSTCTPYAAAPASGRFSRSSTTSSPRSTT